MKSIKLILAVTSIILANSALAEQNNQHAYQQHQFMSKRPYTEALASKSVEANSAWEGATYIADENNIEQATTKNQQSVRLNMLSRRVY
jgi:hypothetical protein